MSRASGSFREWRRQRAYDVLPVFPPIVKALIRTVGGSLRVTVEGEGPVRDMVARNRPFVLAFFHGRQFTLVYHSRWIPLCIMTSESYMGDIQTRTLEGFGYSVIRGSSSRGGARVLAAMVGKVREGYCAGFAVDGPRGPHRQIKPGVLFLAKKLNIPVIPVSSSAKPALVSKSAWDRYILPLPFARAHVVYGEPLFLDRDTSDGAMGRDTEKLTSILENLDQEADRAVGRNNP